MSAISKHPVVAILSGAQSKAHISEELTYPVMLPQSIVPFSAANEQVVLVREGLGSGGQVMGGKHSPCQHCNSPSTGWVVVSGWVEGEAVVIV